MLVKTITCFLLLISNPSLGSNRLIFIIHLIPEEHGNDQQQPYEGTHDWNDNHFNNTQSHALQ